MKILVITRSSWDDSNSIGNTMSNIFSNWELDNIANIYVRAAMPNNKVCKNYYSISDKDVIKSIFKRKFVPGKSFLFYSNEKKIIPNLSEKREERIYRFFRKNSSILALWIQELVWSIGKWKNQSLDKFLNEFKPDIIFSPSFHTMYTHKLLWYIQERTNAKVVLFHADDYLTINANNNFLKKFYYNLRAKTIIQSVKRAELNYCISQQQQKEYSLILNKDMKLLYKGSDFLIQPEYKLLSSKKVIQIVYVGSILYGRWKTLAKLAKSIQIINNNKQIYELLIYSQYQPTKEAISQIVIEGTSRFMGKIPFSQVKDVLFNADIVLHIESFDKKERLLTRLSFSTKIVDCLHSGRTVMAIGWKDSASIDYLIENDAAIVITDESNIIKVLFNIMNNRSLLIKYAEKAWDCGQRNHKKLIIQENLYNDFVKLLSN